MSTLEARSAIDTATRKLSPEDVEKILLEAYGSEPSSVALRLVESASSASVPADVVPDSFSSVPDSALPENSNPPAPSALPAEAAAESERGSSLGKWAAWFALPIGIAAYFGYRKAKKLREEPREASAQEPFVRDYEASAPEPAPRIPEVRLGAAYPALMFAASDVLA